MMRLIAVEMRRLVGRRLLRVMTILVIAAMTTGAVLAFNATDKSLSSSFKYTELEWILGGLGSPLLMLAWLLGATSIGAEWHHRTITTLLTWESRRIRVIAAKAAALTIVTFLWIAFFEIFFSAAFYPVAAFHGTFAGVDAEWWLGLAGLIVRAVSLSVIAALFGFSIAAIGRNTAAALGIGFVYIAVIEGLIRGFRPQWVDWLVGDNIGLALLGSDEVSHLGHSQLAAGLLLIAYAAVLILVASAVFRSRDLA